MVPNVIKGFLILLFILVPIERLFSLHPQKIVRPGWGTDAIHFVIGHFVGRGAVWAISVFLIGHFFSGLINSDLQKLIASQPVWLQFIETVLIAETGYYTAHRLTHTVPWLWQFHAIHHSGKYIDWLAAVRVHPIDQIFTKVFQILPIYILGFNEKALVIFILFSAFEAFFIHSNIRFKFRGLSWVIVTPAVHHWHHSSNPEAYNKNFAAQLPILDILLGTFYLPANKTPEKYGISDPVPLNYVGQLFYPFRSLKMESISDFWNHKSMLNKIKTRVRPLPLILCCAMFGLGVSVATAITVFDIPSIITGTQAKQVTVAELQQGKIKPILLIDVRDPQEYAEDRIGQSSLIPLTDIEVGFGVKQIRSLVLNTEPKPTLVLYCSKGSRSIKAYKSLKETGLNMVVLSGGITAWRKAVPASQDKIVLEKIAVPIRQ